MASIRINKSDNHKYQIQLHSSIYNLILFTITSTLKDNKTLRFIIGIIGFVALTIGLFAYFIPMSLQIDRVAIPLLFVGFILIISTILSSNYFELSIGKDQVVEEREKAEETYELDTKNPFSYLELDTRKLNEYYSINQKQAKSSFRWAVFAMFCGFVTIIVGIWLFYFGKITEKDTFLTSLTTVAGVIINLISGTYLYLHNKTQKRSLYYYRQLVKNQQLGLVIRLSETHTETQEKTKTRNQIIGEILELIKIQTIKDNEIVKKEIENEK